MAKLDEKSVAPAFSLPTAAGHTFVLEDEIKKSQKGVIVYFYPKALTPGCTTEACDFKESEARLQALGYTVVGISPDKVSSLIKFQDTYDLPFALASDEDHRVAELFGAWGEKKNYGKVYQGLIRSTFIIDKAQKIVRAFYNVRAKGHVERIVKEISTL